MVASGNDHKDCLQLLIAAGAKLDEKTNVRECQSVCLFVCLSVCLRIGWVKTVCVTEG